MKRVIDEGGWSYCGSPPGDMDPVPEVEVQKWGVFPRFGTMIPGFKSQSEAEEYVASMELEGAIVRQLSGKEPIKKCLSFRTTSPVFVRKNTLTDEVIVQHKEE